MAVVDSTPPRFTLISGPAGSGKSRWAEHLAASSGLDVIYVATGPILEDDFSWQERLRRHRDRRPPEWHLWEVGGDLSPALARLVSGQLALIDSLGTWVAAHLEADHAEWSGCCQALLEQVRNGEGRLLMVGEECGWGVVPPTAVGGRFRERLADLQQRLAAEADASWLVIHGRALDLMSLSLPVPGGP
ncbi:MAG: bifunctional adenosylcobinamide kinase/adenosylcobinamide-phosphate guanylyltransferase [Cyanobacteria bacterium]|nr:bifunctional adenosylcobinamide kinase/adenosylcobinamide-phosphate guanylyltransferase [Cyanobacteriota bacterium]